MILTRNPSQAILLTLNPKPRLLVLAFRARIGESPGIGGGGERGLGIGMGSFSRDLKGLLDGFNIGALMIRLGFGEEYKYTKEPRGTVLVVI